MGTFLIRGTRAGCHTIASKSGMSPFPRRTIAPLTSRSLARCRDPGCLLLSSRLLSPPPAFAAVPIPKPPAIDARAYVLIDYQSGRMLAGDKADVQMEPASITKLMTGYVRVPRAAGKSASASPTT